MLVLSLDISAASTGFAVYSVKNNSFHFGLIKTDSKDDRVKRLNVFKKELTEIIKKFEPTSIVLEDVYNGPNVKTMILLAKFAGVAEECCFSITEVVPHIVNTNSVKAYFKVKDKEGLFLMIADIFGWGSDTVSFKKDNDLTDAIGQLIYFCDIMNIKKFRFEKEYGYFYEVNNE